MLASSHKLFDGENGGAEFWEGKKNYGLTVTVSSKPWCHWRSGKIQRYRSRAPSSILGCHILFFRYQLNRYQQLHKRSMLVCQPFNSGRSFLHLIWYDLVLFSNVRQCRIRWVSTQTIVFHAFLRRKPSRAALW